MFVRVQPEDLVHGTQYKIGEKKGTFIRFVYRAYGIWHYLFRVKGKERQFGTKCPFYKYVSDNPQEKMERRAVNLIVRKLIGDECFEW